MQEKCINIVIVGFGHQSRTDHLPSIEKNKSLCLVGILDPYFEGTYKSIPIFKSIESLDDSRLQYDAVLVSVPHDQHYQIVKNFLERGKHIFKEKPAAMTRKDLIELCQTSKKHGSYLMVNAQRRLMDHYQEAKKMLNQLGDIFLIEGKYSIFVPNPEEGWRGKAEIAGGGCIIDMGYHLIDLLTLYFGLPDKVMALKSTKAIPNKEYSAEDTATILFEYDNAKIKANGTLIISRFSGPKDEYLKVTGSKGILEIRKNGTSLKQNSGEEIVNIAADKFTIPINHFADVIINKETNLLGAESHIMDLSFIEACYDSINSHSFISPINEGETS